MRVTGFGHFAPGTTLLRVTRDEEEPVVHHIGEHTWKTNKSTDSSQQPLKSCDENTSQSITVKLQLSLHWWASTSASGLQLSPSIDGPQSPVEFSLCEWDTTSRGFIQPSTNTGRPERSQLVQSRRDSLCRRAVDALVSVERTKRLQVAEEFVRALGQGVLGIQDALQGTKPWERDTGRLTPRTKRLDKWVRLQCEVCVASSGRTRQVRQLLPGVRKQDKC